MRTLDIIVHLSLGVLDLAWPYHLGFPKHYPGPQKWSALRLAPDIITRGVPALIEYTVSLALPRALTPPRARPREWIRHLDQRIHGLEEVIGLYCASLQPGSLAVFVLQSAALLTGKLSARCSSIDWILVSELDPTSPRKRIAWCEWKPLLR